MPTSNSYPGVYITEVSSGVRPIAGVATSVTAFVGRARRGPISSDTESPVRIYSFAEYERVFGGLWNDSPMSFAVYHYFLNGGAEALIVRVHHAAVAGRTTVALQNGGSATFTAANPGAWAERLRLRMDADIDDDVAGANPVNSLFNVQVKDLGTGVTEIHRHVSITQGHPRFVGDVLRTESTLLRGPTASLDALPLVNAPSSAADPFDDPTATSVSTLAHDGDAVNATHIGAPDLRTTQSGLFALERADLFNMLCIPPFAPNADVDKSCWEAAVAYATERRAIVLVDPPFASAGWDSPSDVTTTNAVTDVVTRSANAALYFPRLRMANPLNENRPESFAPCGAVAGGICRTDTSRGVWKSPAGTEATVRGVLGLAVTLTDAESGSINAVGVNCLRRFSNTGPVVWGARTLAGENSLASEWKYLAVRRTALFLEESLSRGMQWVLFEPNDEPLWAQIRLNVGAFMHTLFRQGAFQGQSPREAYFVKCDRTTTTQTDIANGVVNIVVGFAPLKPAEFVIITLKQAAGVTPA